MLSQLDQVKAWLRKPGNIDRYLPSNVLIDTILAEGGQGIVYRGKVDETAAAIKVYFPGQLSSRIEREIEALKALRSDSVVSLLWADAITVNGQMLRVVVTTLIPGESLEAITRTRRLAFEELGILAFDVVTAINCLWDRHIVHRDLKPSNIVITPAGRACVIDLGVARHVDLSTLTAMGFTAGTLGYLSPEQAKAVRQLTCKSDLYSLGVILLESALGRHPARHDQQQLISMRLHENLPVEIAQWKYAGLLKRLLEPQPTKRPRPSKILELLSEYAPTH